MSSKQIVLVIEDDAAIRRGVVDALRFEGFDTRETGDGAKAMELVRHLDCDLVLLDLVLPKVGGLDILRELCAQRATLPVIILSAMGDEADRVAGLKLGADDYVVKPFSVLELLARVHAVLRRSPQRPTNEQEVAITGGMVSFQRREVRFADGRRHELSEREAEILAYLARNAGRVISREELLENVWRVSARGLTTRTIDMHIARLREKLSDDSSDAQVILTVRGKGYSFGLRKGDV